MGTPNMMKGSYLKVLSCCTLLFFVLLVLSWAAYANTAYDSIPPAPQVRSVIPEQIFPDMFIFLQGTGIYQSTERTWVIFSQGESSYRTYSDAGGLDSDGLWEAKVKVPKGLHAGICKIEVEVENIRSRPVFVKVTETARPPKLTYVSAPIVTPGSSVWINGKGFSGGQILEMRDAEGQRFTKSISDVSTGNSIFFEVPSSAYSG